MNSRPDTLNQIKECVGYAQKQFTIYLSTFAYGALVILQIKPRDVILDRAAVLPVIQIEVPLTWFHLLYSVIILLLYAHFQRYYQRLGVLQGRLVAADKDYQHPWFTLIPRASNPLIGAIQSIVSSTALWISLPIGLYMNALYALRLQKLWLSIVLISLFAFGFLYAITVHSSYSRNSKSQINPLLRLGIHWISVILAIVPTISMIAFSSPSDVKPKENLFAATFYQDIMWKNFFQLNCTSVRLIHRPQSIADDPDMFWHFQENREYFDLRMQNSSLEHTLFSQCSFYRPYIESASMRHSMFRYGRFDHLVSVNAKLDSSRFSEIELYDCSFSTNTSMTGSVFSDCDFFNCTFSSDSLGDVRFKNCTLVDCKFSGEYLISIEIRDSQLFECDFSSVRDLNPAIKSSSTLFYDCSFPEDFF